jgi:DNA-binding GntR family transcriptional regulator
LAAAHPGTLGKGEILATSEQVSTELPIRDIGELVASQLRNEIIHGELVPGQRLLELELASRFSVSRGPVRDALTALTREGLVVSLPRRGSIVSSMSVQDIAEVYEARQIIELGALHCASERASDEELAALGGHLRALDLAINNQNSRDIIEADLGFHRGICIASHNPRLVTLWESLASQSAVLIGLTNALNTTLIRGVEGHHQLVLDALIARDPQRAGEILAEHFQLSRQAMSKALAP